jgi:glycosyltransferase involved in cell wall biosynthesis
MRVLHAPIEISGQMSLSVRGLRACGVEADLFAAPHAFGYDPPDIVRPPGRPAYLGAVLRALRSYDVFHFGFASSFSPRWLRLIDARALRLANRRVVVEFHGSDVRMPSLEAARNPYYVRHEGEDDLNADTIMRRWSAVTAGHAVTCDHHLDLFVERHFEHIHHVGHRVDTARLTPHPPPDDIKVPTVVHAPSHLAVKGTGHLRRAVEELRAEGVGLEYVELHGKSHAEVLRDLEGADLVVDQLCAGAHGALSIEAMGLAKPVICYMLPDYAARMPPDCPIINANPLTIKAVLSRWLADAAMRHTRGLASRAYVERHHDIRVVARRLIDVYEALPGD